MSIKIERIRNRFVATVSPPHGKGIPWKTDEPLELDKLTSKLLERGCHQTDIGDAIFEIDPALLGLKTGRES